MNNSQSATWENRCSSAQLHILPKIIVKNYKRSMNNVFCEEDVIVYNWKSLHWGAVVLPGSQNTYRILIKHNRNGYWGKNSRNKGMKMEVYRYRQKDSKDKLWKTVQFSVHCLTAFFFFFYLITCDNQNVKLLLPRLLITSKL